MNQPKNNFIKSDSFVPGVFFIEDNHESVKGYTCGQYWNGWECPYFDKETSADVINSALGYRGSAHFDESEDSFIVCLEEGDEPETFKGLDIVVSGEVKHVYPIGFMSWCWEKKAMTDKQKELLLTLARTFIELSEECQIDDAFHDLMIDNADLYTMSLDEVGHEFMSIAHNERGK